MSSKKIKSIYDLKKRKRQIIKETVQCEEELLDSYYSIVEPFASAAQNIKAAEFDNGIPMNRFFKIIVNAKRIIDIVRLGSSVYQDFRKK